ncbi:MAG: ComEC/Rec2 family competence protein [Oscillospiraceae bacterium]
MKIFKSILLTLLSIISISAMVGCNDDNIQNERKSNLEVTGNFKATFLDVGKADSMILTTENHTVIIDCGEKGDGKNILNYLEDNNISKVDYLIITHFDQDHVGGASKIVKNVAIDTILQPYYEKSSNEYDNYCEAMQQLDITPNNVTNTLSFNLDDVSFTVYPPQRDYYGENEENDFSLVVSSIHGENSFLFSGDAEETRLDEIMSLGDIQSDFLKVPYHGNYLDNLETFFKRVNPKYAVICCSEKNYASQDTLSLLDSLNVQTYITCDDGNITATSDGTNIQVVTQKS